MAQSTVNVITDSMLQTITEKGKAVALTKRFANRDSCYQAYRRLWDEDEERAKTRMAHQGVVDCNPPLSQSMLKKRSELWRANFSTQQGRAIRDSNAAALWSLQFASESLIAVTPNIYDVVAPTEADALQEGAQKMAMIYTRLLRSWPDYYNHEMAATNDIVTHGIGWLVWWDAFDPHPSYIPHGAVKFPPRMRAMIEEMNVVYMEAPLPVGKLIQLVDNDQAETIGWNKKAIVEMLIRRYGKPSGEDRTVKYDVSTWESLQQEVKNNDMGRSFADMETVPVVYAFVVAPDEKSVSVFIMENADLTDKKTDYLFEQHGKRKSITECVCPCFYNIGDGYLRSIKGIISLVYPQLLVGNLSLCATADAAYLMGTVILEDTGSNDMRLTKIGPVTRLPAGSKPMQQSFSPRIDGFITLYELMARLMNQNAGVYKRSPDYMTNQNKTAEEARIDAENEARLEGFQAMLYYLNQDRKHTEIMRRLLATDIPEGWAGSKEAEGFRKACIAAGVPEKLLNPANILVRASRVVGSGSATMARMALNSLMNAATQGVYDQAGTRNIVRDYTAQQVGWDVVDRYAPAINRDESPSAESSFATIENNDIMDGKMPQVAETQDHLAHTMMPIAMMENMARNYMAARQGQAAPVDPRRLIPVFGVGMQHAGEHLNLLARNVANRGKAQELSDRMKELDKFFKSVQRDAQQLMAAEQKQMQENAAAMQAEAAQRDPTLRAEARKDAVTQADIQRKDAVAAAEVQRKGAKAQVDMQTKVMKTIQHVQGQAPAMPMTGPVVDVSEAGAM